VKQILLITHTKQR